MAAAVVRFGALNPVQRHTTITQDHSLSFLSGEAWQVALVCRYGSQQSADAMVGGE